MIEPRKLAAIDIFFLGNKIIIGEFALGVLLCGGLGAFTLYRAHSLSQFGLGLYLIALSINYVPMLLYAVRLSQHGNIRHELGVELDDQRAAMSKYRRQSLWLLVPLAVVVVALVQAASRHSLSSRKS